MNDLIKGAVIGAAIATAAVSTLTNLGGEPEHGIVRSIRAERATATANPRCAARPIKMPCFQPDPSPSRGAS